MIVIDFPVPDWIIIRQALSLSLLKRVPITIARGAAFLNGKPVYRPIFDDLTRMADEIGTGRLFIDAESIIFEPRPVAPGRYRFDSAHTSAAAELLLFLMPALFHGDFRSILDLGGVTHSPLSCPTAFIKEALLAALERMGLYGSLTLRRFGFHGSGGGDMESRLYPREKQRARPDDGDDAPSIAGVKIFISRLDTGLAEIEKGLLAEMLSLDVKHIAIIEVMESDGPGNGIQVFASFRGMPVVLFREMSLYDGKGEPAFSEDDMRAGIEGLAGETRRLMGGALPERLVRELYPYAMMTGVAPPGAGDSPGEAMTMELCDLLL